MRKCSKCNSIKNETEFYKSKGGWCKECDKENSKKRWNENSSYRDKNKKLNNEWKIKNPIRSWALRTINGHKKKNYIINITVDQLCEIAIKTNNCPICSVDLDWRPFKGTNHSIYNSPTLDRINNEKILNLSNVWIICNQCNMGKGARTLREYIDHCHNVIITNGDKIG